MITINLLPRELRPVQRTPLPHILSLLVLAAALVYIGNSYLGLSVKLNSVRDQVKTAQNELAALQSTVEEYEALMDQKQFLMKKITAIQDILRDRTIWSEQLHRLVTLTPENIWYKRIRVTSRKFMEERPSVDKRTGKPEIDPKTGQQKMVRVPVDRPVLEVSGYAVGDETGMSSTASLAENTTADAAFAEMFTLYTSKITDTEFNEYPVREFTFSI